MKKQVKLVISGLVQGVCFRVSTREQARQLGLDGWVKNLADGSVSVFASGETRAIDEFIAWCRTGPKHARVDKVLLSVVSEKVDHKDFIIL
jgi:acylphosphatase